MNWLNEWSAISGRIEGLISAGNFYISSQSQKSSDSYNAKGCLMVQAKRIYAEIEKYNQRHISLLPLAAQNAFKMFLRNNKQSFTTEKIGGSMEIDMMNLQLISLSLIRAEINYFLTDFEFYAAKRSERAFMHLQQCIIADENIQKQWEKAFLDGEVKCEKLGGAHLLWHGIYAFKINGGGARTDLVFNEPLEQDSNQLVSAEALVLTEWKKVHAEKSSSKIAKQARKQADLYAAGVLGGLELKKYRYIILVSEQRLANIEDVHDENRGYTYRHINIAVDPSTPSVDAKK